MARLLLRSTSALREQRSEVAEEVPPVEVLSEDGVTTEDVIDWRDQLLAALKAMDPSAFERLCQRLLRESGFVKVEVTGKSGDG